MARDLLLRGMLAGLLAGLLAFGFATLFGEPQLELAIGFEATQHASHHADEPELVSRAVQRGLGLLTACLAVGVALGGILAIAYGLAWRRVGRIGAAQLAVLLAAAGFIVVVLVPQLKYPANPPAVGTDETIALRTLLYFEMILVAAGALLLAVLLARLLLGRIGSAAWLVGAAAFIGTVAAVQMTLPNFDEVPSGFPHDVLWRFRLASVGTQFVLWAGLAAFFGVMARRLRQA